MNTGARRIAILFATSALGCSYISGYEWLRFFAYFGVWGTIGIIATSTVLTWFGYAVMNYCHRHEVTSLHQFISRLIGEKIGPSLSFLAYVIMVCYAGVMIYQWASQVSAGNHMLFLIIVMLPCIVAIWFIEQGLVRLTQFAMLMLLLGFLLIGFLFTDQRHIAVPTLAYQFNSLWFLYSIFYLALHCLLILPILIPLATQIRSPRSIILGIVTGGLFYTIIVGLGYIILLAYWHEIHSSLFPLMLLWDHLLPAGGLLYYLVSVGQLIISLACWFYGLTVPIAEQFSLRQTALLLLMFGSVLLCSYLPFISDFYQSVISAASTYTGMSLLVLFFWKQRF